MHHDSNGRPAGRPFLCPPVTHDAIAAYDDGRWFEALAGARAAVASDPGDPDALALLGRIAFDGDDLPGAIGLLRAALVRSPMHVRARRDLDAALDARPDPTRAAKLLAQACSLDPSIAVHCEIGTLLLQTPRLGTLDALVCGALLCDPALAEAHAVLGAIRMRQKRLNEALASYARATALRPDFAEAYLGYSLRARSLDDERPAEAALTAALALQRVYVRPASVPHPVRVLVLHAPVSWEEEVSVDLLLDGGFELVHLYLPNDAFPEPLPAHDAIVVAISDFARSRTALDRARVVIERSGRAAINAPDCVPRTVRAQLHERLAGIPGVRVPKTRRLNADAPIGEVTFPIVMRPVDAHGGRGVARIDDTAGLAAYRVVTNVPLYDVSDYIDYVSGDGLFRKYRLMFVAGVPYAYHLAISPHWVVHYLSAPMDQHPWMREEEMRFLTDWTSVFGAHRSALGEIAARLGLDYFGIDATIGPAGELIVFEADAAMFVHCEDDPSMYAYKHEAVPHIFRAFAELVRSRASR